MRLVVLTVGEIYDSWQNECSAIHLVSVHDEVSASCFGEPLALVPTCWLAYPGGRVGLLKFQPSLGLKRAC